MGKLGASFQRVASSPTSSGALVRSFPDHGERDRRVGAAEPPGENARTSHAQVLPDASAARDVCRSEWESGVSELSMRIRCRATASRKPGGKRRLLRAVRSRNPRAARPDRSFGSWRMNGSRDRCLRRSGQCDAATAILPAPTFQAALGQRVPSIRRKSKSNTEPGLAKRRPIHSDTGTLTALPTSFQRVPAPRDCLRWLRPVGRKALEPLGIADVGQYHATIGKENCGRRRDAETGAALEGRDRIDRPSEPTNSFRPVKTTGHRRGIARALLGFTRLIGKEHRSRIAFSARNEVHAFAALRQSEGLGIDDAIGPHA